MLEKKKMLKVKSALLQESITIPGAKVFSDFTISPTKQPGVSLLYGEFGLLISYSGGQTLVPPSNIKCIALEDDA